MSIGQVFSALIVWLVLALSAHLAWRLRKPANDVVDVVPGRLSPGASAQACAAAALTAGVMLEELLLQE